MTDLFASTEGATPLDVGAIRGLRADWISTQGELNAAEQVNILNATTWAFGRRSRWTIPEIADRGTLTRLHRRMFGEVWRWAGDLRHVELTIGPSSWMVPTALEDLCRDLAIQAADPALLAWPPQELAVRFHHRLVAIHPFLNGNGRHARLTADLIVHALASRPLTWGGGRPVDEVTARRSYLAALRRADEHGDYGLLLAFARS